MIEIAERMKEVSKQANDILRKDNEVKFLL